MKTWIVTAQDSGQKLVTFLQQKLGGEYSARHVKKLIEANLCRMDGRMERFASKVVRKGSSITFDLDHITSLSKDTITIEFARILFEDESFVIYDKPAGIACDDAGILAVLRKQWPELLLVHRLDRDTTGVLICAKNPRTLEHMVSLFKQQQVHKTYWALVDGLPQQHAGVIENRLAKVLDRDGMVLWGQTSRHGQVAHTTWTCKRRGKGAALVVCVPKTGRTHQIRVHMNGMGHPILGDYRYSQTFICSHRPLRTMLHAKGVAFIHPITGIAMQVEAPIPADFCEAARQVGVGA